MAKPTEAKNLATSVYVPAKLRQHLEELALEVGFKRGKQMTSSSFVQYLIQEYGGLAKDKLIKGNDD